MCSTANEKLDKYNDDTGKYDQTVFINGESVSTLSTSKLLLLFIYRHYVFALLTFISGSGQAQGWGTAVECQDDACQSTTAAHGELPASHCNFHLLLHFNDTNPLQSILTLRSS